MASISRNPRIDIFIAKMADKYKGSFVSKSSIDAEKSSRKLYLEKELERARDEFESKKRLKELKVQRGETTWMLPSLNKRLKHDDEKHKETSKHKKKKKKQEKKSKKNKKEKKHKKKQYHSDSSKESRSSDESSDNDEWVEKAENTEKQDKQTFSLLTDHDKEEDNNSDRDTGQSKRDDWMMSGSFLDVVVSSSESVAEKRAKKLEEKKALSKPTIDQLGQHKNEINPYWKNGGTGVPTEESSSSTRGYKVGAAGLSWVKKAYERAKEQAKEQGRTLEEVVAERWGSMEKLNALLQTEEKRKRRTDERQDRRGWRSKDTEKELHKEGWKKHEDKRVTDVREKSREHDKEESYNAYDRRKDKHIEPQDATVTTEERKISHSPSTSESEASDSSDSEMDESMKPEETVSLSEKEINEISAKILRAELMGDEELAESLKAKLEAGKSSKATSKRKQISSKDEENAEKGEEIILTRTDRHGNVYPLKVSGEEPEPRKKRKKTKKIDTHDAKGNRLRYFAEDDATDLKAMVEEERLTTVEDHQTAVMSRLTKKLGNTMGDYYTLDDMFESSSASKTSRAEKDERAKKRAIAEQQKIMTQQASCRFCFDNPDIAKHLIISIGSHVYLALPITSSLTEGHCMIIPNQHVISSTYLDEDVMREVTMFKSSLTKMFKEKEQDVIFLETVKNIKRQHHMFIECVPVPDEVGDLAPIYFKKAIQESESEWAQNKKLVEVSKNKGIKAAVPKGLPYFSVEFGMDGGYAHVIEDESLFQHYFGKEIIGGILDLEPTRWRRPPKESFQQHKRKVLNFAEIWEPFDWTRDL